jgi:multisubunit Na+/H+ antiporter MnhB subunit
VDSRPNSQGTDSNSKQKAAFGARPASLIAHNRDTERKSYNWRVMDDEPEVRRMFFRKGKIWLALMLLFGMFAAAYLSLPGFRSVVDFVFDFVLGQ